MESKTKMTAQEKHLRNDKNIVLDATKGWYIPEKTSPRNDKNIVLDAKSLQNYNKIVLDAINSGSVPYSSKSNPLLDNKYFAK